MGFSASIKSAFVNWRNFSGRALRSEYWFFTLFYALCSLPFDILKGFGDIFQIIGGLIGLVFIVPHVAVFVRRLHDTDHSGWWLLGELGIFLAAALLLSVFAPLGAVAIVVAILVFFLVLFWLVIEGDPGANRYGPPHIPVTPRPGPVEA